MSKQVHKSAVEFAIKHHINLGRFENGHYYIGHGPAQMVSNFPTAKSALVLMRRYKEGK